MKPVEAVCAHHIRPEHLNHHLSLFGGTIASWMCEAAFIATVRLRGRSDGIVMTRADEVRFLRPLHLGDVLELRAAVERLGRSSIVLRVEGTELLSGQACCSGRLVFVTVDENGRPARHNLAD